MESLRTLEELDLTPIESAVYLFLLQNGPSYGPQLQTALELQKVPIYRALKALKAKGYIETLGETRNQRFAALPAQTLLDAYDTKAKQLANARNSLETLIRDLANQQNDLYKQNKIKVYEGKEGYRLWNEERIGKDVDMIRELGNEQFMRDFFGDEAAHKYIKDYIHRRVRKGIAIRMLHNVKEPLVSYNYSDPKILKETRETELPDGLQIYLSVFGQRFGFYTKHGGRYLGVIIDDPVLAQLVAFLFDSLWNNSKIV